MLSDKKFIVTIGNYGAVVALHNENKILSKIFLEELNDKTKEELGALFKANKSSEIYILLDTLDQSYKKKVYPSVTKSDLSRVVQRDMNSDADKESLKNFILLNPKKTSSNHRWECLFVSSSKSDVINNWVDFLLNLNNHLVGIYMLPVEAFSLFKLMENSIKSTQKNVDLKNDIHCLIIQNKVSGIRQIVFSSSGIVFTRVVNYDFTQKDFLEKYERDIYSTFEYLKRIFPDIAIANLNIVNIFQNEVLEIIKKTSNLELKLSCYTPFQAASELGYSNLIPQDSQFCDLLISKIFYKQKKILKFDTPQINLFSKMFLGLKVSHYANLTLIGLICLTFIYAAVTQHNLSNLLDAANTEISLAQLEVDKIKSTTFDGEQLTENGEVVNLEKVIDFGKIETALGNLEINLSDFYEKLIFLTKFHTKLSVLSYNLASFDYKNPPATADYKIQITGELINKTGDIENLFTEFDLLASEIKKSFNKNNVQYPQLPKDMDFSQKYYSYPVNFTIGKN